MYVSIGVIGKSHGIKGFCYCYLSADIVGFFRSFQQSSASIKKTKNLSNLSIRLLKDKSTSCKKTYGFCLGKHIKDLSDKDFKGKYSKDHHKLIKDLTIESIKDLQAYKSSIDHNHLRPQLVRCKIKFLQINNKESISKLVNYKILCNYILLKNLASAIDYDYYFYADLYNLVIKSKDDHVIGHVAEINNYAAGDILTVVNSIKNINYSLTIDKDNTYIYDIPFVNNYFHIPKNYNFSNSLISKLSKAEFNNFLRTSI